MERGSDVMREILELRTELLSDAIFSSGYGIPGGEDIALKLDEKGMPYLAGATFKGLLRESMENLLCWEGRETEEGERLCKSLMGEEGRKADTPRRLIFSDFHICDLPDDAEPPVYLRRFTALEDGVVKEGTLRMAACVQAGTVLRGFILCEEADRQLIADSACGIKRLGLLRNRGFGSVRVRAVPKQESNPPMKAPADTHWLRYLLRLETPMAATLFSKNGVEWEKSNFSETRTCLPGSAVRGMVVSALAEENPMWFAEHKTELLDEGVRFLSAYPQVCGQGAIPTPRGFYEDKQKTRFYSVLTNGKVLSGDKHARLGHYCLLRDGKIIDASPHISAGLRIRRGNEKEIFTVRTLAADTVLEGYIYLSDPGLTAKLSSAFKRWVWLGADRYAGYGLCRTKLLEAADKPCWADYSLSETAENTETLTMLLLSPTCMLHDGEPVGLDLEALAELLGSAKVELLDCASSVMEESGCNRTWGCFLPADRMYREGSVFRLHCTPAPTAEALRRVEERGLGIRKNEGFGQVLFLTGYDTLAPSEKDVRKGCDLTPTALRRQARCKWLLENQVPAGMSKSQIGTLQALLEDAFRTDDYSDLNEFFRHNIADRGVQHGEAFKQMKDKVDEILRTPLYKTLGLKEPFRDTAADRARLICDWLDLSRKGEAR